MYAALALQFAKADAQSQCLADCAPQRVGEGTRRQRQTAAWEPPTLILVTGRAGPRKASWLVNCEPPSAARLYAAMSKPGLRCRTARPTGLRKTALTCVKRKDQGLFSFLSRSRAANGPPRSEMRYRARKTRPPAAPRRAALLCAHVGAGAADGRVQRGGRRTDPRSGRLPASQRRRGGEDSRAGPAPSDASRAGHGLSVAAASIARTRRISCTRPLTTRGGPPARRTV